MDVKKRVNKMFAEIANNSGSENSPFHAYLEEILKQNLQLEIINQIAKSITIEMSFEEMMEDVATKLQQIISYDLLNLCLLENGELVVKTAMPKDTPALNIGTVLDPQGSWSWEVVRRKQFSIKTDIQHDGGVYARGLFEYGINSFVIVPVMARSGILGTLNLGSRKLGAYKESDAHFLQQVADQLGLIIENARLYREEAMLREKWENSYKMVSSLMKETEKRNTQLKIINQIAKSITVEMSLEDILDSIADKLKTIISYDHLSICLLEAEGLVIKASLPKEGQLLGKGAVFALDDSGPAKAINQKKIIFRPDIAASQVRFPEDRELLQLGISSGIIVPLIVKGKAIGTLILGSRVPYTYSEEDATFLEHVADQLALCIENARLYAEESKIKQEWEATFNATTDMIMVIDRECRLVRVNKAVEKLHVEFKKPIRVGEKCYLCFNPKGQECKNCPARCVFLTRRPVSQRFHLSSGRILDITAYPIFGDDGHVREVVNTIKDVTEKVNMEAQLVQSAKLAAIGELAAGVAHELNSPLTAIIGDALLLLRDEEVYSPDKRKLILEDIRKCGERCKNIIQNLSTFARQEQYTFETLNLNDIVEDALSLVSYQIEKSCIKIFKELQEELPPVVGSRQHLEQVIVNFLLNARDSFEGKETRQIYIRSGRRGQYVYIAVEDTGCGIDPDQLDQIFTPFYTTKKRGTGLGLSICKKIADDHGGKIEVKSQVGKGSTFSLLIPVAEQQGDL
ncbi:MAG TPA: histidine kinase [Peptococcaceae bacterium]|nr:histidine kinase [Peptococcaceae bacterium]